MSKLKDLTLLVAKYEKELNTLIQDKLNDNDLVNGTNEGLQKHLSTLRKLRKFNEFIAQQLNLPTKDDVAAIAKLVMQVEEKLDRIEDLLMQLLDENPSALSQESLNQPTPNNDSESQQADDVNADQELEELSDEESSKPLKSKIMNFVSEMGMKVLKDAVKNALAQRGNTGV
jgi:lipopolysaccharide biosynthesis regulator YciM